VSCQLQYLRYCLRQRIQQALDELPDTLNETYDCILEEIGKRNWEYAHRLFQCVAAASCPLRVEELAEFLTFDFDAGSTPTLQEDWREEDPTHAMLSICSSLLEIVDVDGSSVIQFSHFSVKEYLTSKRLAKSKETISRFHVSMTLAHTIIAQACIGVLLHIDQRTTKDDLEQFPLANYAAEHWVGHARFEGVSPKLQDGIERLFDPNKHHLSSWVWIYDPERQTGDSSSECPSQARATPLHYVACCDLSDIARFLIVERSQSVNARAFERYETPLNVASRLGYSEVARVLLEHDADPETRDNRTYSPLERASENRHVEVLRVLLKHCADVKYSGKNGPLTALHLALWYGEAAIPRVLLKSGADPSVKDKDDETPLHRASNDAVARVLLEYGADPDAQDSSNRTPLHGVMNLRSGEAAWVLLENGVDANAQDAKNQTPLHVASEKGYLHGVRLLLHHGADIYAWDDKGRTPFQVASASASALYRRRQDVMQLLLEYGAEDHSTQ